MAPRSTAAFPIFLPGSSSVSIRGRKVPSRRSVMPTIRAQASRRVKCKKAGPDHRGTPLNAQLATLFWPSLMPHRSSPLQSYEMMKSLGFFSLVQICTNEERSVGNALCGVPRSAVGANPHDLGTPRRAVPTEPPDLGTPRRAFPTEPPDGSALVQVSVDASSNRRKPRASNNLDGPDGALDSCFSQANRPPEP